MELGAPEVTETLMQYHIQAEMVVHIKTANNKEMPRMGIFQEAVEAVELTLIGIVSTNPRHGAKASGYHLYRQCNANNYFDGRLTFIFCLRNRFNNFYCNGKP